MACVQHGKWSPHPAYTPVTSLAPCRVCVQGALKFGLFYAPMFVGMLLGVRGGVSTLAFLRRQTSAATAGAGTGGPSIQSTAVAPTPHLTLSPSGSGLVLAPSSSFLRRVAAGDPPADRQEYTYVAPCQAPTLYCTKVKCFGADWAHTILHHPAQGSLSATHSCLPTPAAVCSQLAPTDPDDVQHSTAGDARFRYYLFRQLMFFWCVGAQHPTFG